jgi:hypothetical protein
MFSVERDPTEIGVSLLAVRAAAAATIGQLD